MNREPAGFPALTAVVPCRNEARFIGACLDSLLETDYPRSRLEVLVVDGMSSDGTRERVAEYASRHPEIRLLDNPKRILAAAWNVGIREAKGEIVVALNAHTAFCREYLRLCVEHLQAHPEAGYVGGVVKTLPQEDTELGRAIATVLSHPFGVGASKFRVGVEAPTWSDTAAFGGYRRSLFDEIGLFNEELVRSQDMELHLRLGKAGKRILLVPGMVGTYYTRSTLSGFLKFCYINGYWATYPLRVSRHMLSPRHLVPMAFVALVLGGLVLAARWPAFAVVPQAALGLYTVGALGAGLASAVKTGQAAHVWQLPPLFTALHVLYGLGSLLGLLSAAASRRFWKNLLGAEAATVGPERPREVSG